MEVSAVEVEVLGEEAQAEVGNANAHIGFQGVHRMSMFGKKYLSEDDLKAISGAIAAAELSTCGEIRVVVRHRRRWGERKLSLHDLALKEFSDLGMQTTKDRTGVLIFILFSERKFHIVADKGIHTKVEEGTWSGIAASMSSHFTQGNFRSGIIEAVKSVGETLSQYFPRAAGDTNELSNDVVEQ